MGDCQRCEGKGYLVCATCQGKKRLFAGLPDEMRCPNCQGKGKRKCVHCGGLGQKSESTRDHYAEWLNDPAAQRAARIQQERDWAIKSKVLKEIYEPILMDELAKYEAEQEEELRRLGYPPKDG